MAGQGWKWFVTAVLIWLVLVAAAVLINWLFPGFLP